MVILLYNVTLDTPSIKTMVMQNLKWMHLKNIVYTLDVMTDDLATEVTTFPQEVSPTSHKAYSSQALLTTTMLTPTTTQQ